MFGGVRRRRHDDRKAELPLIAAGGYGDAATRRAARLDAGQEDTADESDCAAPGVVGGLRFYYDCKHPLQCYQVTAWLIAYRSD